MLLAFLATTGTVWADACPAADILGRLCVYIDPAGLLNAVLRRTSMKTNHDFYIYQQSVAFS